MGGGTRRSRAAYGVNILRYTEIDPHRGAHQPGVGDPARPRLLVLLRRRQAGPLPAHGGPLHDVVVVAGGELRRARRSRSWPRSSCGGGERSYFVALIVVGTILVGRRPSARRTRPRSDASVKASRSDSTVGLALRSTNRATPLVILGMAVLLGAGCRRAWRDGGRCVGVHRRPWPRRAWWRPTSRPVDGPVRRHQTSPAPSRCRRTGARRPPTSTTNQGPRRARARPACSWNRESTSPPTAGGSTLEPVLPGPHDAGPRSTGGSCPTARPGRRTCSTPSTSRCRKAPSTRAPWRPWRRLMSAGDLVLQSDLAYEHYNTPRPRACGGCSTRRPPGLGAPGGLREPGGDGQAAGEVPADRRDRARPPPRRAVPPPVAVFSVPGARPILRAEGASTPIARGR